MNRDLDLVEMDYFEYETSEEQYKRGWWHGIWVCLGAMVIGMIVGSIPVLAKLL